MRYSDIVDHSPVALVSAQATNGSPKESLSTIQVQLYGYELRLVDAEKPFRNLLTLSLKFPGTR
jgi:hypothetical protein